MNGKGRNMLSLVFFLLAFVIFVISSFWLTNSENTKATSAEKKASEALSILESLEAKLDKAIVRYDELDERYRTIHDAFMGVVSDHSKLEQKMNNKFEMMDMTLHKYARGQKITLAQEKPIQISVVYRQAQPRTQNIQQEIPGIPKSLIKDVKKKLSELSQ